MWDIVRIGLEDIAKTFGIEENLYTKYVEGEIKKDPDLMALTERRNSNFDWQVETPLGGAGTTLNACVLYCLIRYYGFQGVLETGVSGGYYSTFMINALLKADGFANLTSLELSSDMDKVGSLVPQKYKDMRNRWALVTGRDSVQVLKEWWKEHPKMVYNLWCHDSLHTMSHMLKELTEFKKCDLDRFFVFIDDEKSDNFWQKCLQTGAFKKSGYDVKWISGVESRLQGHLGGFLKYERIQA
jgi:hypothetical protein